MKIENIKFKAKELGTGKWKVGFLQRDMDYNLCILIANKEDHSWYWTQIDPSTVCMFTGLKDCEGKEIWEGDIIRTPEFPFEKRTVTWSNNSSCFMPIDEDGCQDRDFSFLVLFKEWTVVGNKFDKKK